MLIKDISIDSNNVNGQYLITNVNEGLDSKQDTYLTVTLQDISGTIEAKKWKATLDDKLILSVGNIVEVDAKVTLYRDKVQLNINRVVYIDASNIDVTLFTPVAPIPLKELEETLDKYINSIKDDVLSRICKYIINKYYKDFISFPAATKNHHEYSNGLLHHTVSMANLVDAITKLYKDLDYDYLMAGALLHDIGKIVEFSGPVLTKYTLEGNLLGHISIGNALIFEASKELNINDERITILQHLILSHHGKNEFGSPVTPLTREALILAMIDDLDAKLVIVNKALSTIEKGEYTQKIFALDNKSFYKPNK